MRLTILQTSLHWENADANRNLLAEKLAPLHGATDLVVLPEMFTTGFSMNAAALAEPMDGPTVDWLQRQAAQLGAAVTGSFICRENGVCYNRLVWVFPDGRVQTYDKHHLFALAGEDRHYGAGARQLDVEWQGWNIRPLICYDLRFPEWARNHGAAYDVLIYVANWPARRAHHWRALLAARAIENQCYVAGVNIVGTDGAGLDYTGDSSLIDYAGNVLCQLSGQEGWFTGVLSYEALAAYRRQLPFLAGI
jgi:omega-amidase